MKNSILLALLGLCAFIQSAGAISITIQTVTPETLVYDVEWGPTAPPGRLETAPDTGLFGELKAFDYGSGVGVGFFVFFGIGDHSVNSLYFQFASETSREFVTPVWVRQPQLGGPSLLPVSVTPTASGYGAHVVYHRVLPIPDAGSSLALLGLGLAGCACLRRRPLARCL